LDSPSELTKRSTKIPEVPVEVAEEEAVVAPREVESREVPDRVATRVESLTSLKSPLCDEKSA